MNVLQSAFLGILQGLTEFLPVSSSGHLVAAEGFLGVKRAESTLFEVNVHVGTLLALIVIYRKDLLALLRSAIEIIGLIPRPEARPSGQHDTRPRFLLLIILAMLPTIIIAVLFQDTLTSLFDKPKITGFMLIITGVVLLLSRFSKPSRSGINQMPIWAALLIGTMQGIAIVPGISRSGSTIALGLLLGLERRLAADFSFILSVPAILGAALWSLKDLGDIAAIGLGVLIAGLLASFAAGLVAILLVLRIVRRGKLWYFAPYCVAIGILIYLFAPHA